MALAVHAYAREHKLIADEFLEELIVRRELAFNFARFAPTRGLAGSAARLGSRHHARNTRATAAIPTYSPDQFERAQTHDALWNATQNELLCAGRSTATTACIGARRSSNGPKRPKTRCATMIHLHDRYALDGRDPNTYTNILWCFGLHDRPWPERPIFGQLRYMSYDGMRRKTDVDAYPASRI